MYIASIGTMTLILFLLFCVLVYSYSGKRGVHLKTKNDQSKKKENLGKTKKKKIKKMNKVCNRNAEKKIETCRISLQDLLSLIIYFCSFITLSILPSGSLIVFQSSCLVCI